MSKIVIKKKVSFNFLGDEYKEGYCIFRSIPTVDYDEWMEKVEKTKDDNKSPVGLLVECLMNYFIEGKFPVDGKLEDIDKEDLKGLDNEATTGCFKLLTGQELDPKDETPSTTPSTTEATT